MSRYRCEVCDYVYDERTGEPREGFPPGTAWSDVPDDWTCPDCGVRDKVDFVPADAGAAPNADGDSAADTAADSAADTAPRS